MTAEQFWNDNGELFSIYEEAYITKLHTESHIQGLYIYKALETIFGNAFAKKGSKALEYPNKPIFSPYDEDYLKQKEIKNKTEKEKDGIYRNKMSFWNKIIRKNKKGVENE